MRCGILYRGSYGSKSDVRLVMEKNRVAKILGKNFIFGRKKIGLGPRGYGVNIIFDASKNVVSMNIAPKIYVLTFYH